MARRVLVGPRRHRAAVQVQHHEERATSEVDGQQRAQAGLLFFLRAIRQAREEQQDRDRADQEAEVGRLDELRDRRRQQVGRDRPADQAEQERRAEDLAEDLRERRVAGVGAGRAVRGFERLPAHEQDHDRREHAATSADERSFPCPFVARVGREEVRGERADVDPHVEDVEPSVALGIALHVEVAHHRADVGLEEPVADAQQHEPRRERPRLAGREQEEAARVDEPADQHRLAIAEEPVREDAAEVGREVDEREVDAVDLVADILRPTEAAALRVRRVEQQHRDDRVEAEALPHLDEEQSVEALRMASEHAVLALGRRDHCVLRIAKRPHEAAAGSVQEGLAARITSRRAANAAGTSGRAR